MGTNQYVKWCHSSSTEKMILSLKQQGKTIVGVETVRGASCLYDMSISSPHVVFILGNERYGLSEDILKLCDEIVRVPVFGCKNSLNIGVCASVVGYEMRRRLILKKHA